MRSLAVLSVAMCFGLATIPVHAQCTFGDRTSSPTRIAPLESYGLYLDIAEDHSTVPHRLTLTVIIVNRSSHPLYSPAMRPPCGELSFDVRTLDGTRIYPFTVGSNAEHVEVIDDHSLIRPHSKRAWQYVLCTGNMHDQPLDAPLCALDFVDVPDGIYSIQANIKSDHVILCPNRTAQTACLPTASPKVTFKIANTQLRAILSPDKLSN